MTRATSKGDSELRLPQERVKYAMLGGSKAVVGTSIASYDRCTHHGTVVWRSAAAPPYIFRTIMPLHDPCDLQGDSELRLPQERAKYAILSGSEVVVGTNIASYDRCTPRIIMVLWRSAAAPPHSPNLHTPLYDSTRPPKVILSLDCPKNVSSTRYLAALKWWFEPSHCLLREEVDGAAPPATTAL